MKKLLVPLAAILLLALAVPAAFSEAELGIGLTPGQVGGPPDPNSVDPIINFHVGYSWSILYLSWDAYAMPDYWVYNNTTYVVPSSGDVVYGYNVPGFLNLWDVGAKIVLRPFIGYAEIGLNTLYLRGGISYGKVGVNFRVGAGVKFGFWGVNLSGTQVFASGQDMSGAFHQAWQGDWSYLTQGMVPTLNFVIYF
jgi:hypothetical protein